MPLVAGLGAFLGTSTGAAVAGGLVSGAGGLVAANQANNAAKDGAAAISAANQQSAALQRDIYNQNVARQDPYVQSGYGASTALTDRLGLNGSTTLNSSKYLSDYADVAQFAADAVAQGYAPPGWAGGKLDTPEEAAAYHYQTYGQSEGRQAETTPNLTPDQEIAQQMGARPTMQPYGAFTAPGVPTLNPDDYRASDYYKYMVDETGRNTNSQFAARGMLQSGAAAKEMASRLNALASQDYQQWTKNELDKYDRTYTGALDSYKSSQNAAQMTNALNNQIYDTDYNRLLNQSNLQTQNLYNLTALGSNAAANVSSQGQAYANNVSNLNSNTANALATSYGQQAANNNAALGNALGTVTNGIYQLSNGYGSTVTPYGAPTQAYSPVTAGQTAASAPGLIYRPTVNF